MKQAPRISSGMRLPHSDLRDMFRLLIRVAHILQFGMAASMCQGMEVCNATAMPCTTVPPHTHVAADAAVAVVVVVVGA